MIDKDRREPLDVERLHLYLQSQLSLRWEKVDVVRETGSTNDDLLARSAEESIAQNVLIADHQTKGRGRLGRLWEAPPCSQISLSFGVAFEPGGAELSWLPLVVGLSVRAMLSQYFDSYRAISGADVPDPTLKWPNDVLIGNRKVAGILVQLTPRGDEAVVGVGLNVDQREEELPVPSATSLRRENVVAIRQQLVPLLLMELEKGVEQWRTQDPGLATAYRAHCGTLGKNVKVSLPGEGDIHGVANSIDHHGRLVIVLPEGTSQIIDAGDVQHVRWEGYGQ